MQYYKIPAILLKEYVCLLQERSAHVGVAVSLKHLLQEQSWVRDDVDFPEAVETAEIVAFEKPEVSIDETRLDGYRWITKYALERLIRMCYARDVKMLDKAIITMINMSPYPGDDPEYTTDTWRASGF